MTETTLGMFRRAGRSKIVVMMAAGVWVAGNLFLAGCTAPTKPEPAPAQKTATPVEAFNEICSRSLNDDLAYVRGRISPGLLQQLNNPQGGPTGDQAVKAFMDELRMCQATSFEKTAPSGRAMVQVARGQPGVVRLFQADMIQDERGNWQLASKLYGERPLPKPDGPK